MKRLLLVLALLGLGCDELAKDPGPPPPAPPITDPRHVRALRSAGITDAVSTGPVLWACSDSDSMLNSTGFRGKDHTGAVVSGAVCCGWLKGCTVRFE